MVAVAEKSYSVRHVGRNVAIVDIPFERRAYWQQWFLLSSDRHHDNPKSLHWLESKHLDEARERRAGIIDVGDLFCAMQGKFDKRASKSDIRPEHQRGDYLDALVRTAADFYEPYADLFDVIGRGNHESSILKNHETDLVERLVATLGDRTGARIQAGGYGGYVRFQFSDGEKRCSRVLKYFHGSGGGGPVTKGVIQANRRATFLPDADIVVTGHVHEQYLVEYVRERLSDRGKVYHDPQTHVCAGTYKEEYTDGFGGWHVERGAPPKPVGAWWLRFFWDRRIERVRFDLAQAR